MHHICKVEGTYLTDLDAHSNPNTVTNCDIAVMFPEKENLDSGTLYSVSFVPSASNVKVNENLPRPTRSIDYSFYLVPNPLNHLERCHSSHEKTHFEAKPTGKPVSYEKGRNSGATPTGPDEGIFVCFSPSCPVSEISQKRRKSCYHAECEGGIALPLRWSSMACLQETVEHAFRQGKNFDGPV